MWIDNLIRGFLWFLNYKEIVVYEVTFLDSHDHLKRVFILKKKNLKYYKDLKNFSYIERRWWKRRL